MKEKIFDSLKKILKLKHMILPIVMLLTVPCVSSLIFGYEFSAHKVSRVPTVIVNHDDSSLAQSLVNLIKTNESFNVVAYSENNDDVKSLIDNGTAAVGVIIPPDFAKDLTNGNSPKVIVFYDGAQTSLASASKGKIGEILNTIKSGFLVSIGEAKLGIMPEVAANNIVPIRYNSRLLGNPTSSMTNFFIQGMLLNMIQIGLVIATILVINKDDNYKVICAKTTIMGLIASISTLVSIYIQYKYFAVPFRGSITAAITLTIIYDISMSSFGAMLNLSKKGNKIEAIDSSAIVASTMMFAGYTFPILAMPSIFSKIAKYVPFAYYALPLRDLTLVGGNLQDVLPDIYWLLKFLIFMWIATFLSYRKSKKTKKVKKNRKKKENELLSNDTEVILG